MQNNLKRIAQVLLTLPLLTSCGGGSKEDEPRCAEAFVLSYSWTYQGYQPTNQLAFTVGKSTTYKSIVTGLPAACKDSARFSQNTFLPIAWISVDPVTGDVTGFPQDPVYCIGTTPIAPGGGCSQSIDMVIKIPGYGEPSKKFNILLSKVK